MSVSAAAPSTTTLVKPVGSTGTGIDQLVSLITEDPGLARRTSTADIYGGAAAADGMNALIVQAIRATGVANNGDISAADLYDVNAWLRANHLSAFTLLHGDDEDGQETGFHRVQNDGATTRLFERNAVNTVADGIYHLAFEIRDGQFLNEDGAANAKLVQVSQWLGQLLVTELAGDTLDNASVDAYVDGTTGTGLDQLVSIITNDAGLNRKIANADIRGGASAADGMNALIVEAIRATGVANNGDISIADLRDLNTYLRGNHLTRWTQLHGDDADSGETGFHLVQADGAGVLFNVGQPGLLDPNALAQRRLGQPARLAQRTDMHRQLGRHEDGEGLQCAHGKYRLEVVFALYCIKAINTNYR